MLRTTHISVKQALVQSPLQHPVTVVLLMGGRAKQPLICLQTNVFPFSSALRKAKGNVSVTACTTFSCTDIQKDLFLFCFVFLHTNFLQHDRVATSSFGQAGILSCRELLWTFRGFSFFSFLSFESLWQNRATGSETARKKKKSKRMRTRRERRRDRVGEEARK